MVKRLFDASYDGSSDEEEVDINAECHASSGRLAYSYTQSASKRIRKVADPEEIRITSLGLDTSSNEHLESFTSAQMADDDSLNTDHLDQNTRRNSGCKQGASVMMASLIDELPSLQDYLLRNEYHSGLGHPCECGSKDAKYRCVSCTQNPLRCRACIVKDHDISAWHHLEEWLGTHFGRTSLSKLGYRHRLGHFGKPCPNRSRVSPARSMVIGHVNGFHEVFLEFCACNGSQKQPYQLINSNLFPASLEKPETAFTFELLDTFQKLNLRSKINAYDYHRSLQEMTDAALPEDTPNRYHEFIRIYRVWDHLSQVRRSGQCHNFDEVFPFRRQGSITVRCPACPEIHVNVDKRTVETASEDETHKYTLFLSMDGNFKLRRKNKRGDPEDLSLNNGSGYFVAASPYAIYLDHTKEDCDEEGICAHLRALKFRNALRFKNADVSGVIIVQCARHGLYQPEGVADLTRGEGFRNTDYALARALSDAHEQRWIMVTYDIWCAYHKKLSNRFGKWFRDMLPVIDKIRGAVPKMHIKNHEVDCQYLWALNYLLYSGETSGELIEACHSEQNGAAASTKEQNPGHRHDSLDAVINYWNWTKFRTMASLLYRSFVRCLDTLKTREKQFMGFTARLDPILLKEWETTESIPRVIDKKVQSVHRPSIGKGPPSLAKAHEKLHSEECARILAGVGGVGITESIEKALDIEEMQLELKFRSKFSLNSEADLQKVLIARQHLRDELDRWRTQQFMAFPKLCDEHRSRVLASCYQVNPEEEPLLLPSDFSESHRLYLDLSLGEKAEKELRQGRAHDRLEDVRKAVQTYNHHVAMKAKEVRSQRHITRAQRIINELRDNIRRPAHLYNKTRQGLISLGLPEDDPILRELKDNELWAKNTALPAKLGDSRKSDPWYWYVACPASSSTKKNAEFRCERQVDRVKYFRDRSLRDRAREEREILEEEFKRTARSYDMLRTAWLEQADQTSCPGSKAYAQKQAAMLNRLSAVCAILHEKARKKAGEYDKWFEELRSQSVSQDEWQITEG